MYLTNSLFIRVILSLFITTPLFRTADKLIYVYTNVSNIFSSTNNGFLLCNPFLDFTKRGSLKLSHRTNKNIGHSLYACKIYQIYSILIFNF